MVKNFGQNLFSFLCEGEFRQLVWFWMGDKKQPHPKVRLKRIVFYCGVSMASVITNTKMI